MHLRNVEVLLVLDERHIEVGNVLHERLWGECSPLDLPPFSPFSSRRKVPSSGFSVDFKQERIIATGLTAFSPSIGSLE